MRRLSDAQSTAELVLSMLRKNDTEKLLSVHLILGEIHRQRNDWKKAEKHFKKASKLDSENLDALFGLLRSLEPQKKSKKKREEYRAASARAMQLTGLDKRFGPELIDFRDSFGTLDDHIETLADLTEKVITKEAGTDDQATTITRDERMMLADFVKQFSKINEKARDVMKAHDRSPMMAFFHRTVVFLDDLWMTLRTEKDFDWTKIGFPMLMRIVWPPLDGEPPLREDDARVIDFVNLCTSLFAGTDVITDFVALRASVSEKTDDVSPIAWWILLMLGLRD